NQGACANLRLKGENASLQKQEIASAFQLKLEPAVSVHDTELQGADLEPVRACADDFNARVLEIVGPFAFKNDIWVDIDVEPASNTDRNVGKSWHIEIPVAGKAADLQMLCSPRHRCKNETNNDNTKGPHGHSSFYLDISQTPACINSVNLNDVFPQYLQEMRRTNPERFTVCCKRTAIEC